MQPQDIIKEGAVDFYTAGMYIIAAAFAFIIIIGISKNIPDIIHNYIIGLSIKTFKKFEVGEVFVYGNKDWELFKLNGISLTFREIATRVDGGITTGEKKLTKQYSKFIRDDIITTGEKY